MAVHSRTKGRRAYEGERFAAIPVDVVESEAFSDLNHAAVRVLVILASQYWGTNNGALALTGAFARKYGFSGRDTIYSALRELREHGLIVRTRRGLKIKNHFSLYALGWRDIDSREGQPLDKPERSKDLWRDWKKPPEESEAEKIDTDDRE